MEEQIIQTSTQPAPHEVEQQSQAVAAPLVDIYALDGASEVVADLPGVSGDAVDVQVKDNVLTIEAKGSYSGKGELLYREFEPTGYYRRFQLSDRVDANNISANMQHGVLTLHLPKAPVPQPTKINVAVS